MKTKFISFRAGFTNVYFLIQDKKILLVDTGSRNLEKRILKFITSRGYQPSDLKLIFLTHTHYDHSGSVAQLKKLTGAKVIVHESEAGFLSQGFTPIPKGNGMLFSFISWMGRRKQVEHKVAAYQKTNPEIVFTENLSLHPYGFDAEIFHSPGHTIGSSGLVFEDKAIVGDAMFNLKGSYWPGFADDQEVLRFTWKKFLGMDVSWFYPAHGKRISKANFVEYARKKGIQ
jgi:glyoxylase-like metal-dependent hydrolase (beta-lactamase superfamily II)